MIYRRYRSKDELVTDAVATLVGEIEIPDTGSTRSDLLALMRQAVELYSGSLAARLMPTVIDEMRRNPELAAPFETSFWPDEGRRCVPCSNVACAAAIHAAALISSWPSTCSAARSSTGC
jgi:AcrR family transcriptional regulator